MAQKKSKAKVSKKPAAKKPAAPKATAKKTAPKSNNRTVEYAFVGLIVLLLGYYLFFAAQPQEVTVVKADGSEVSVAIAPPYSFEEVFFEVQQLDARYLTDFRNEELREGPILGSGSAKEYLGYLEELRSLVEGNIEPGEEKYVESFLDGRENQLLTEIYFQQATQFGQEGIFRSPQDCERAEEIKEATFYYNKTRHHGAKAMAGYDQALGLKRAWEYIGVNTQKPRFYSNIFIDIAQIIEINQQSLAAQCSNA